jgi:hypothetical protein
MSWVYNGKYMKNPGLRRRINFHGEAILHRICDFNLVAVGHIQENLTSNKREEGCRGTIGSMGMTMIKPSKVT